MLHRNSIFAVWCCITVVLVFGQQQDCSAPQSCASCLKFGGLCAWCHSRQQCGPAVVSGNATPAASCDGGWSLSVCLPTTCQRCSYDQLVWCPASEFGFCVTPDRVSGGSSTTSSSSSSAVTNCTSASVIRVNLQCPSCLALQTHGNYTTRMDGLYVGAAGLGVLTTLVSAAAMVLAATTNFVSKRRADWMSVVASGMVEVWVFGCMARNAAVTLRDTGIVACGSTTTSSNDGDACVLPQDGLQASYAVLTVYALSILACLRTRYSLRLGSKHDDGVPELRGRHHSDGVSGYSDGLLPPLAQPPPKRLHLVLRERGLLIVLSMLSMSTASGLAIASAIPLDASCFVYTTKLLTAYTQQQAFRYALFTIPPGLSFAVQIIFFVRVVYHNRVTMKKQSTNAPTTPPPSTTSSPVDWNKQLSLSIFAFVAGTASVVLLGVAFYLLRIIGEIQLPNFSRIAFPAQQFCFLIGLPFLCEVIRESVSVALEIHYGNVYSRTFRLWMQRWSTLAGHVTERIRSAAGIGADHGPLNSSSPHKLEDVAFVVSPDNYKQPPISDEANNNNTRGNPLVTSGPTTMRHPQQQPWRSTHDHDNNEMIAHTLLYADERDDIAEDIDPFI